MPKSKDHPTNAVNSTRPAVATFVLFDADCPLCRTLAAYGERHAGQELAFVSWQTFQASPDAVRLPQSSRQLEADRLRVLHADQLLEGEQAWSYLIEHHRDLAVLNWLAAKTGLHHGVARMAEATGHVARRLCSRCRR